MFFLKENIIFEVKNLTLRKNGAILFIERGKEKMKNVLDVLNNYLDNELKQKKERTFKVGNIHKVKKIYS